MFTINDVATVKNQRAASTIFQMGLPGRYYVRKNQDQGFARVDYVKTLEKVEQAVKAWNAAFGPYLNPFLDKVYPRFSRYKDLSDQEWENFFEQRTIDVLKIPVSIFSPKLFRKESDLPVHLVPFALMFSGLGHIGLEKLDEELSKGRKKDGWVIDGDKNTLLHFAAAYGCEEAVERCLEAGIDINAQNQLGVTALHNAVYNFRPEIVRYLIRKKADVDLHIDESDETPFTCALGGPTINEGIMSETLEVLIHAAHVNPDTGYKLNTREKVDQPPMHIIVMTIKGRKWPIRMFEAAFRTLIDLGANPSIQNQNGVTPLQNAAFYHRSEIGACLASFKEIDVDEVTDSCPFSPLYIFTTYGLDVNPSLAILDNETFNQGEEFFQALIEGGARVDTDFILRVLGFYNRVAEGSIDRSLENIQESQEEFNEYLYNRLEIGLPYLFKAYFKQHRARRSLLRLKNRRFPLLSKHIDFEQYYLKAKKQCGV